jgi:lipopolysaccharide transport system ATP-binding protein
MSLGEIRVDHVSKLYPQYFKLTAGFKSFLFHLPSALESMRHAHFEALHDVSFSVAPGESLGIVGHNGAGKSTVLGLLAGVVWPSEGKVTMEGRIAPVLELGAGFHPDLSGEENVILNAVILGLTRHEAQERLGDIVAFSELGDFIDQPIRTYSSGMLVRLGFSVAVHTNPDILLIDEVLAVGDSDFQRKSRERILDLRRQGVSMVLVSHAMVTVRTLCDNAIWIEHGRVQASGTAGEVVDAYESRAC